MIYEGVVRKMKTEALSTVGYFIIFEDDVVFVNTLINKRIKLELLGFHCIKCSLDKPIYRMGHCKSCYFSSPATAEWVIRPELCTAHLGKEDRDIEYERNVQLQPHVVYLADTGDVKVGITRKTQIPTRWIDQGANRAMSVMEVPNRYLSGLAEVALKAHIPDKTNWRNMLKGKTSSDTLHDVFKKICGDIPDELKSYILEKPSLQTFSYPVLQYPRTPKSVNLSKTETFEGVLSGIKGQYLLFENSEVLNLRNHEGYVVRWSW